MPDEEEDEDEVYFDWDEEEVSEDTEEDEEDVENEDEEVEMEEEEDTANLEEEEATDDKNEKGEVEREEEGEVMGREEREAETEVDGGVEENWEVEEVEMTGTEEDQEREREGTGEVEEAREQQKRAGEGENELDVEVTGDWEVDEEDWEYWEEEDDEEEWQVGEQIRGTEGQDLQGNPEGTMQESQRVNETLDLSGSATSKCDESDWMGSGEGCSKFFQSNSEKRDISKQHKELEVLDNAKVEGHPKKEAKARLRDKLEQLPEEEGESTEDEDAENSTEEEEIDDYDEDLIKFYSKDGYVADVFHTLAEFRYLSLLTDLTLSTEDGASFNVHSLVLAAVSSLIRGALGRSNKGRGRTDGTRGSIITWSLPLGPEVDRVGLEAVVEFAYTGQVSLLRGDTVYQIKTAAQKLGAPRVLDLCKQEEEKSTKTGRRKEEKEVSAEEELEISLTSMKQLWMDRVGCDVILEAVEGSLHVHRVILAVGSDYFRSMFTLGMKESHQPRVALPFLLASELEVLVSCSYSGTLPLSWKCVFEITSTALQLQYQPALHLCLNFLQQEINPHSCLDVASFAEAYEMTQLLEVADDYVLRQFQKVARTSKYKDLPAKQLFRYLNSHSLCVPSELVVFKAVVAWIQAKPKKRLRLARMLMRTIQFPLMTFKEFKEVQSLNMWSDHSLAELFEAIFEDFCANDIAPQTQCRIYLPKESLVLIGGDQTSEDLDRRSISRDLWFGNSLRNHTGVVKSTEWRKLGEMPEPGRFRHEVTVLNGQLYVFGGKKYYGTNDTLKSVYRYDPLQNTWESLAEMQEERSAFSVVLLEGKILAIGGQCEPVYRESVEQYCPTANSWRFMWPLDLPLGGHVAKVLHGKIYVSGGLNSSYRCISSMFLYNPESGSTYLANMAHPRAYHCMETLGDLLYVAGGVTVDRHMNVFDGLGCEVYSPVHDTWTAFTPLPVPHVGAGSAVLEGKFYVMGGYSQEDYSDTNRVHRYDPSTQRWESMGRMPGPNNDIRATLLCLPKHFRT
ncbi:kelch-like protein 33 [Halichoeres trimaculatus]|uniref:kelch-like protein 33 n=1 Tax=Halichoeres trimaculatus TaxID=147232 RepID=UPI003D9DC328